MDERNVGLYGRAQLGLITNTQAVSIGISQPAISRRVASGRWRRVRRGVYAEAASVPSYEQAVLAVVLSLRRDAVASHRTAAKLLGLQVRSPDAIDIATTACSQTELVGVRHHRWLDLPPSDVVVIGAIPCTSVGRTLVDCVNWLVGGRLKEALDDARRRGLVTITEVEKVQRRLDRGRRTGARKMVPLRPVVALRAAGQQAGGSARELNVLVVLRKARLPLPVQQFELTVGGQRRFLDYAYPKQRIALEFDGFAEHGQIRSTFDDDRVRNSELALAGWIVLGFTSETPRDDIVDRVRRALNLRTSENA